MSELNECLDKPTYTSRQEKDELCLVFEYNWNYPRSEVTKTALCPVWSPPSAPGNSDPSLPPSPHRMHPNISRTFMAKRERDNLQSFLYTNPEFYTKQLQKLMQIC